MSKRFGKKVRDLKIPEGNGREGAGGGDCLNQSEALLHFFSLYNSDFTKQNTKMTVTVKEQRDCWYMWFSKGFTVLSSNLTTRATRFPKFCQSEDWESFIFSQNCYQYQHSAASPSTLYPRIYKMFSHQKKKYKQNISITINTVYRFGFVSDFILL